MRRRLNVVSYITKGRGRAKSQLRCSGVSQNRHRKERNRHNIFINIKNDYNTWEEFEYSPPNSDSENWSIVENTRALKNSRRHPVGFVIADIPPQKVTPKSSHVKNVEKVCNSPPIASLEIIKRNAFRSRLISDCSVDSEGSNFIVFEGGSEGSEPPSEYETDDSDSDDSDSDDSQDSDCDDSEDSELDSDTESDEDLGGCKTISVPVRKVRFHPKVKVHKIIAWDYAYRAARVGPWEQCVRDRDRFRARIRTTGNVISPILSENHRETVWKSRFQSDDKNFVHNAVNK